MEGIMLTVPMTIDDSDLLMLKVEIEYAMRGMELVERNIFSLSSRRFKAKIGVVDNAGKFVEHPAYHFVFSEKNEETGRWFERLFEGVEWMMQKVDGRNCDKIFEWYTNYDGKH